MCIQWIYPLEAGLLTVKAGGSLEDALKNFFDELLKQRLFIENIMGIFDNGSYLHLILGQSENYENSLTEFGISGRHENSSYIKNEIFQKYINYIQFTNGYEFLNGENFKNENISWLKEAENIINVFEGGSTTKEKNDISNFTLTKNNLYSNNEVYNDYFSEGIHKNGVADTVDNIIYSSTVMENRDIFNEVLHNNYPLFTEESKEELLQSVIRQSDKKYYINKNINGKNEYFTLNGDKNTEFEKWLENTSGPYESGKVNITLNNYSNIYNQADEESIIDSIAKKIIEYAQSGAEGVHI